MKAAVRSRYGIPADLAIKEMDIPPVGDHDIRILVHASTVNRTDCHVLSGKPLFMRIFTGLFTPNAPIIGSDFAGEIDAVGSAVSLFQIGEKVMGFGGAFGCGSHAQYFTLSEEKAAKRMMIIPSHLSFDEAAACLEGAVYAAAQVYSLPLKAGQKALVYGATGAIGTAYVQFLKAHGLYVTAVCRGQNRELVHALGADKMVDYTVMDFTHDDEQYDYVFDAVGKSSFFSCKKLLKKNGSYTSSGGFINLFLLLVTPLLGSRKVIFSFSVSIQKALTYIRDMLITGKYRPVIDRKYPLSQITDAYRFVASGEKIGSVIITMDNE